LRFSSFGHTSPVFTAGQLSADLYFQPDSNVWPAGGLSDPLRHTSCGHADSAFGRIGPVCVCDFVNPVWPTVML
jgi:hypothetical protein